MREKILGLLIAAGSLFAIACSRDVESTAPEVEGEGEEVSVTFTLSTEGGMVSSRAESADEWKISDGKQIDWVVYAVYTPTQTGDYELKSQYGAAADTEILGKGQALLPSTAKLLEPEGETLTLRLIRGQEYTIGFWAQNSECNAYSTKDLRAVVVDYTANRGLNNVEERDAYYQSYTFTAQAGLTAMVILKRALAQINVGTAGWDYNAEVDYGYNYYYSKIEMTGLYDQVDVLTGEVSRKNVRPETVTTYTWNKLPAYIHTDGYEDIIKRKPEEVEEPVKSDFAGKEGEYEAAKAAYEQYLKDFAAWREKCQKWLTNDGTAEENGAEKWGNNTEFLKVRLRNSDKDNSVYTYLPYLKTFKDLEEAQKTYKEVTTETFKYLSMCYVLAPTYKSDASDVDSAPGVGGTTIQTVKFYLAETPDGKVYDKDNKLVAAPVRFEIELVPIQRNWRTNILGGARGKETTLFDPRQVSFLVHLSPSYDGEHNYNDNMNGDADDNEHNEWTPDGGYTYSGTPAGE